MRSPAANNGLFGLRPTALRVPVTGMAHAMGGYEQVLGSVGPLSTSIDGIKLFMKTVVDAEPWLIEPNLVPVPWREWSIDSDSTKSDTLETNVPRQSKEVIPAGKERKTKLKIAVMWDDGVVRPHPPMRRVLAEVVECMRKCSDIEVVDWPPHCCKDAWEILVRLPFFYTLTICLSPSIRLVHTVDLT